VYFIIRISKKNLFYQRKKIAVAPSCFSFFYPI